MLWTCCLAHLSVSVCLSLGPENILWQNGCVDPDTVWDDKWGRSRDGYIRQGWLSSKGRDTFEGEVEASHCNQWGPLRCGSSQITLRTCLQVVARYGAYENATTEKSSTGGWNNQVWKNQVRLCKDGKCKYGKSKYKCAKTESASTEK